MGGVVGMDEVEEFEKQLQHSVVAVEMNLIEESSELCVMYLCMLFLMTQHCPGRTAWPQAEAPSVLPQQCLLVWNGWSWSLSLQILDT